MGTVQGYFATFGAGALAGVALGWIVFNEFSARVENCTAIDPGACVQVLGLPFLPFVTGVAAVGGLIGLLVQLAKGELF